MSRAASLIEATSFSVPELASDTGVASLDLRVPHQEQDLWCWCAVTVGVAGFFDAGFGLSQCETAGRVLNVPAACDNPDDESVNKLFALDNALSVFGRLGKVEPGPLAFDEVRRQIDTGRPVGARILFLDNGMAHVTLIRGYRTSPEPILIIDDPLFDESEWSYQQFLRSYRGSGVWKQSYLTQ
jgi:hypothetical protein